MNDIRRVVARVAGRLNWIRFVHQMTRVAFYTALLCMLVIALDKVVHLGVRSLAYLAVYVPVVLLVAAVLTYRKRTSALEAAVGLDQRLDLKERVSSALAIGEPKRPAEAALVEDAAARIRGVEPRRIFPLRAPRELRWLPLPLALAVALTFVPS
ncbi:hypothetical protein HY251_10965 [bacterium]|nr:hypothetical protein [bacterium]